MTHFIVMPGLDPGIPRGMGAGSDARDKPGHDVLCQVPS